MAVGSDKICRTKRPFDWACRFQYSDDKGRVPSRCKSHQIGNHLIAVDCGFAALAVVPPKIECFRQNEKAAWKSWIIGPSGLKRADWIIMAGSKMEIPDLLEHGAIVRSEEHTSELQSPCNLVC